MECTWRSDIDSLSFQPHGHGAYCIVHRRAFGTLLGLNPSPTECESYFVEHYAAFQRAAAEKIASASADAIVNFHLTSRDVARALTIPTSRARCAASTRTS